MHSVELLQHVYCIVVVVIKESFLDFKALCPLGKENDGFGGQ